MSKKVQFAKSVTSKWTLLSTECYFTKKCNKCVYYKYCKNNIIDKKPILKHVVNRLLLLIGEPPQEFIDKMYNNNYN